MYIFQEVPSDSLEATVAAVKTITETIANGSSVIPSNQLMMRNHLVKISAAETIDNSLTDHLGVAIDPKINNIIVASDTRVPISTVGDHIVPMDSIASSDPSTNATNINLVVNNNSVVPDVTNQSVTNAQLISTDITASSDLIVSTEENVLHSLSSESISVDTVSLLQQIQPSGIVISSENNTESIPLILDDVTLLNIELAGENMQIISLSELDSSIAQTQVRYYEYLLDIILLSHSILPEIKFSRKISHKISKCILSK